ncbi:hypothetical protein SAMN05444274_1132 [Mariniphaga anaerophila]|uniref:Cellulase Ig-like domain-containing protein n=1 Tax=Mariniphaga anaerophila TaxID=1484053 RepID=A0A1M5FJ62_9BACT|nr:hypothetical protein [Mariniphaga anaerophila]SHF91518.1 hypothetical protein SAMN05444274_1132 [Mariniphaga anaerophila]
MKYLKFVVICVLGMIFWRAEAQNDIDSKTKSAPPKTYLKDKRESPILVNQMGYNLGEGKRFVMWGIPDGTDFGIYLANDSVNNSANPLFTGKTSEFSGDFSDFNPSPSAHEYIIKIAGKGYSVPFWIADKLFETRSSKLAYEYFIDARGGEDPKMSPACITGGGPSRDGGGQTLEALFEVLLYSANPALFNKWTTELRGMDTPDLIDLILWHGEFAYNAVFHRGGSSSHHVKHRDYNTVRVFGYEGEEVQEFDYQNYLDQLAAICAAYNPFLKPYLDEDTYSKYRNLCLERWETFDRHKEVRYWVVSKKWIDKGRNEFNEQGSAFGQGLFRNTMMYLCEKNEPNGHPERFFKYAQNCAQDIIENWDFNNEWHMWALRNAEHITPQALGYFVLVSPTEVPGAIEKLDEYRKYVLTRTDNPWKYRTHNDKEWAHPKSKELGTVPGLAGSFFVTGHLLNDQFMRGLGWAQIDFIFGLNPAGAHLSHKDKVRVSRNGYWPGVENGWPFHQAHGTGELGNVRGCLDGSPHNGCFPYNPEALYDKSVNTWYHTEGWPVSNRPVLSAIAFAELGSTQLKIFDNGYEKEIEKVSVEKMLGDLGPGVTEKEWIDKVNVGDIVTIELQAPLNVDWNKRDAGWVDVKVNQSAPFKVQVFETGVNTGIFTGKLKLDYPKKSKITVSYGYLGFEKERILKLPAKRVKDDFDIF